MAQKPKWTMNRIFVVTVVPLLAIFIYVALTSKPATTKPKPIIDEFRVIGQSEDKKAGVWNVELSWRTQHADEITIEPGIGKVDADGSRKIAISSTQTYKLKASNPGASVEKILELELPSK